MEEITFLIVDDCSGMITILRGLVSDYFEENGIPGKILCAKNGREALRFFSESRIDVMMTDLKMPGISGDALIRKVEIISPSTLAVLMTATENYVLPQEFSFSVGFLEKPFNEENLRLVLAKITENLNSSQNLTRKGKL